MVYINKWDGDNTNTNNKQKTFLGGVFDVNYGIIFSHSP